MQMMDTKLKQVHVLPMIKERGRNNFPNYADCFVRLSGCF